MALRPRLAAGLPFRGTRQRISADRCSSLPTCDQDDGRSRGRRGIMRPAESPGTIWDMIAALSSLAHRVGGFQGSAAGHRTWA